MPGHEIFSAFGPTESLDERLDDAVRFQRSPDNLLVEVSDILGGYKFVHRHPETLLNLIGLHLDLSAKRPEFPYEVDV